MSQDSEPQPTTISEKTKNIDSLENYSRRVRRFNTGAYTSDYEQEKFRRALEIVAPKIKEEAKKGQLFARWTPDIDKDSKQGKVSETVSLRGIGNTPVKERGISVSVVNLEDLNFGLDRRYDMSFVTGYRPRKLEIIRGKIIGFGNDSEPLINSIEHVLTVPYQSEDPYSKQRQIINPLPKSNQ